MGLAVKGASIVPFADPPWYSGTPSPYYTASHRRLAEFLRTYVTSELAPWAQEWEDAEEIPRRVFKRHAQLGCVAASLGPKPKMGKYFRESGATLPAGISFEEWDPFHDFILSSELLRLGYGGVVWGLGGGSSVGFPPILNHGTERLKSALCPGVINGSIRVCLGITEPQAGSDVAGIQTTARKTEDGNNYIVNGQKKWITNGIWCDYVTAAVRTGDSKSRGSGISVLVIPLNVPGVTRRKLRNSGSGASGSTFIEFDDVKVPVGNLLGRENQGFQIIMSSKLQHDLLSDIDFNAERLGVAAGALSLSRVCLEDAYMYALVRETFGQKLMSHQIIRSKIGLMSTRIAAMHAWLESLIFTIKQSPRDPSLPQALSLAKVQGAQVLEFCVREAQQIFGGAGYQRGSGKGSRVEQISRDVRVNVVGGGSEEILIDLAVRMGVKMVIEKSKL